MSIATHAKGAGRPKLDSREIQYLLEGCRDVGDVRISSNSGEILLHIARNQHIQNEQDYAALKQLEACGNPDVLLGLHTNRSYVSFSSKPMETLKRNLKALEKYLLENPGMVDGVVSKMGYIIENIGNSPPESKRPLIYELPPKGTRERAIIDRLEHDLVRATSADLDQAKKLLSKFVTYIFLF